MNIFKRKLGIKSPSEEWAATVQKLINEPAKPNTEDFIEDFMAYIADWRELDREYSRIPSWRHIKQLRNIKKREKLTRLYVARCKKRGIIT